MISTSQSLRRCKTLTDLTRMSDGLTDDDLSLPKGKSSIRFVLIPATVQKLVSEMLPPDLTFSRESRDLLIECCVEFVHLISSEANEICEKESKKTIAGEHVVKALEELGFNSYLDSIAVVVNDHKQQVKAREKKVSKFEKSGLSTEELLAQQEELLAQARNRYQHQQQAQAEPPTPELKSEPSEPAIKEESEEVKAEEV